MPNPANRPDLVYAAYAVARGFTINPGRVYVDADYDKGIPRDTLRFAIGQHEVWLTARGWRVGRLDPARDQYDKCNADEDFSTGLLVALDKAIARREAQLTQGAAK